MKTVCGQEFKENIRAQYPSFRLYFSANKKRFNIKLDKLILFNFLILTLCNPAVTLCQNDVVSRLCEITS